MKKLFFVALMLVWASGALAQSTSHTWIDVTASPYSAKNDCSADAGPAINSAIAGAPAGSGVIFLPTGCYLIATQIVDTNATAWLSYLGEGNVELLASPALPSGKSIMQFGNDTTDVAYRKIKNLYFNCNDAGNFDGIDLDGLHNSEFYDVTIAHCDAFHLLTKGANTHNYSDRFFGGAIYTGTNQAITVGNVYGIGLAPGANSWSFYGTKIIGPGENTHAGIGLDFEANGGAFYGGAVASWGIGIVLEGDNSNTSPQGGLTISGSSLLNNSFTAIAAGGIGDLFGKAVGVSIAGNSIDCPNGNAHGIILTTAAGFSITGNQIQQCGVSILGNSDEGPKVGSDNIFIGGNFLDSASEFLLMGSYNTVVGSFATVSSNYTLNGADSQINVTGNTSITVPHTFIAQQWTVFNSGSGNVSLSCDSGTFNAQTSISLSPQTGMTVTTDGTNCFGF